MDEGRTSKNGSENKKLVTMQETLHNCDDIRLYVPHMDEWRRLEISLIWLYNDYIKRAKKKHIATNWFNKNNTRINRKIIRKQNWWKKQLCGYFKQQTGEI